MGKEIERKFLVIGTVPVTKFKKEKIKQGYLYVKKNEQTRVRLYEDTSFICIKYGCGLIRDEFEYEIPLKDGKAIYKNCKLTLEKIRTSFIIGEEQYDFDQLPNGVSWMEVEFKSIKYMEKWDRNKPTWLGKEVTGNKKYSNVQIAKQNLKF